MIKKITRCLMAASTVVAMAASSVLPAVAQEEIVTEVNEPTEVTFWHAMNGAQEEALTKITEDFMAEHEHITIKLENQSSYPDLSAKILSTLPSPDSLPTMTQAYPGWLVDAADNDLLVEIAPYMDNETIGWQEEDEPIIQDLLDGAQIDGVQYGIPFNKSVEMLFYNRDLFEEHDLEVPTDFDELKEVSKTIYEVTDGEVVGLGFDSLNNYYSIGMKNLGHDINADLDFASEDSKSVLDYYGEGIREGYFRIAGSDEFMSGPFGNGQVAMFIGSIAGASYVDEGVDGKFEYDVAPRPAPINIQQGTDLYLFDSATPEQKTAAYLYMKYLASPDVQLYWAQESGYMPILESVATSPEYLETEGTKIPAHVADSTKELFAIPATAGAQEAYDEIRTLMEAYFSDPSQDLDEFVESGQASLSAIWE